MIGRGILTLYDRGGTQGRIVEHWGAKPSWQTAGPGTFSAFLTAATARAYDLGGAAAAGAVWLRYQHPCLPDWGGVVTQPTWTEDGAFELGAESFHILLRKRRVPRTYGQQSAPAGALAQRAFRDVQADDYTFIASFDADEDGDPLAWEWRGGDLMDDVLRQLATASGQEWSVNAEREAEWRVRLGTNKVGSVALYHPHEIVAFTYGADLWTVANDIEAVATDQRYERSAHEILDHRDSVRQLGRYQATIRYSGVVNKGTVRPKLRRDLDRFAWPVETMDLTTANVGMSWERYVCGDSVTAVLPMANAAKQVRILARSIDVDAGLERLAVEVEHDPDAWS